MSATRILNRRTIVALAAVGTLLFASTAFTASVDTTGVTETTGYGEVSVSGATLSFLDIMTNPTGDTIQGVFLRFTEDLAGSWVTINFDGTPWPCDALAPGDFHCQVNQPTSTAGTIGISVNSMGGPV